MRNFFRNLFGLSLKSKVAKVIEQRINEVQEDHDERIADARFARNVRLNQVRSEYNTEKLKIESESIKRILDGLM